MYLLYSARKTKLGYQATYELWENGKRITSFDNKVRFTTRDRAIEYAFSLARVEAARNVFNPRVCARTSINGKAARKVGV